MTVDTASLYIHVPFCAGLCDYCDFFSVPVQPGKPETLAETLVDTFVDAVLGDLEDQLALFGIARVPTVYIGGGTPSVLGAGRMRRLLAGLKTLLPARPVEFTVEANPESINDAFLRACLDGGVSRLSLGVQTFHEPSRQGIGRAGGRESLSRRLSLVNRYFQGAFSADLITGLPFQTDAVLSRDIERLLDFRPAHVSLYSLILEPDTVLGRRVSTGGAAVSLPTEDQADALWIRGRDMLEGAGLGQYEVSNFALPGRECVHNIRYWRMENWLGAGPSASGTICGDEGGRRFTYPPDLDGYLAAPRPLIRIAREDRLSPDDMMRESLLMGFRYRGGPDRHRFERRFGRDIADCIPGTIARWRERGFFRNGGSESDLAPSRDGLLFVNGFLRDAFAEMDSLDQSG